MAEGAQDEVLIAVVTRRGLLDRATVERLRASAAAGAPLAQTLVRTGALSADALARALREAAQASLRCRCRRWAWSDLARASGLLCPTCRAPLALEEQAASGAPGAAAAPAGAPRMGPWRLERELGRGSFGAVYLARREPDGAEAAVKVLLGGADADLRARFVREAKLVAGVSHPGIVRAFDAGQAGEHLWFAMEYCPGPTLFDRLQEGPLAWTVAVDWAIDLARALHAAHARGVVHRDVKPANVILAAPHGRPRLTDFGLAHGPGQGDSLTRTGDRLGTPVTMAPEQARGERDVDGRADIYGLGATLYRCLTDRYPHEAPSAAEVAERLLSGAAPAPPSARNPALPPALDRVVLRALAFDRRRRHATAEELARDLEAVLDPGAADAPRGGEGARPGRRSARRRVLAATLAVGALAGTALAAALLGRGEASADPAPPVEARSAPADAPAPTLAGEAATPAQGPAHGEAAAGAAGPSGPRAEVGGAGAPGPLAPSAPGPAEAAERPDPARAPDELVRALDQDLIAQLAPLPGEPEGLGLAQVRAVEAACARHGRDRRVLAFFAIYEVLTRGRGDDTLGLRRVLVDAGATPDGLPPGARSIGARLGFELGFERAAADLALALEGAGGAPDLWSGMTVALILAKARPPVRDWARAARAIEDGLAAERARGRDLAATRPPAADALAVLGECRLNLGDVEGAARAFAEAALVARGDEGRDWFREVEARIRAGEHRADPDMRRLHVRFTVTRSLDRLTEPESRGLDDEALAAAYVDVARMFRAGRRGGPRPSFAALAELRAAAACLRAGALPAAREALARASDDVRPTDPDDGDIGLLAARTRARLHLDEPAPGSLALAEALARAATAPWPLAARDLRTRGERAEAHLLLARARLGQLRPDAAAEALAAAEAEDPPDRRELEEVRAAVARATGR